MLATYFLKILENKHDMIRSHETVSWAVVIGLHPSLRVVRYALIIFHFYLLETKKTHMLSSYQIKFEVF